MTVNIYGYSNTRMLLTENVIDLICCPVKAGHGNIWWSGGRATFIVMLGIRQR